MFEEVIVELMGQPHAVIDERLRDLEVRRRSLEAEMAAVVAVVERKMVHLDDGHRSTKQYLRATLKCSGARAHRLRRAARVCDTVAGVGGAWMGGHVGDDQVTELARLRANPRCGERLVEFAPVLLDAAEHLSYDDFVIATRHWEAAADEDGAHRDAAALHDERKARVTDLGDGGIDISATGGDAVSTAEMVAIFDRFCDAEYAKDVAARRAEHGDRAGEFALPRTGRQRSFDALHAVFRAAIAVPADGRVPEPVVNLIGDISTFTRTLAAHGLLDPDSDTLDFDLADHHGPITDSTDPSTTATGGNGKQWTDAVFADADDILRRRCETVTGTPITPHQLLRAAIRGHVRRVVVDSAGVVIDMGRLKRLFTGSARQAAMLLTKRCTHPGCDMPTAWCDVDHKREWVAGRGTTDQHNANVLCNRHNRHHHERRWTTRTSTTNVAYTIRADGTLVLAAGERPPRLHHLEHDPVEINRIEHLIRDRLDALVTTAHRH